MRTLAIVALLLAAPVALAGTPEEPELTDEEGDCALPYGAGYLDITAAWIEDETADDFAVALRLASFDEALAEGAGYAAQFEHQGERWGVVALYRPWSDAGWTFFTGLLEPDDAHTETFRPAMGSFDEGSSTMRARFPKDIFPHRDAEDRELRAFYAGTADLRPAYPFLLATDQADPDSSDGRWLMCDEARSDATYAFRTGAHSAEHEHAPAAAEPSTADVVPASVAAPAPPEGAPEEETRDVPMPAWLALVALAFSRGARSRRR